MLFRPTKEPVKSKKKWSVIWSKDPVKKPKKQGVTICLQFYLTFSYVNIWSHLGKNFQPLYLFLPNSLICKGNLKWSFKIQRLLQIIIICIWSIALLGQILHLSPLHYQIYLFAKVQTGLYSPDFPKCYFLQIHTKICSKVPIFYFNRPKHPPW